MAFAQHASGTQAATIDTEHTLGTDPDLTDGVFAIKIDVTNMAAGDVLLIRGYEKVTGTGDTQVSNILMSLSGVQTNKGPYSIPELLIHGWKYTLEQTDGTGRSFDWSIRSST